jgi:hypothetical protein
MSTTQHRAAAGGIVLQFRPRRQAMRLPVGLSVAVVGGMSAALWVALFHLFALLF